MHSSRHSVEGKLGRVLTQRSRLHASGLAADLAMKGSSHPGQPSLRAVLSGRVLTQRSRLHASGLAADLAMKGSSHPRRPSLRAALTRNDNLGQKTTPLLCFRA